jgi:hypothetical protein
MLPIFPRPDKKACERPLSAQEARPAGHALQPGFLEAKRANVSGEGWERHGLEVHGAHAIV